MLTVINQPTDLKGNPKDLYMYTLEEIDTIFPVNNLKERNYHGLPMAIPLYSIETEKEAIRLWDLIPTKFNFDLNELQSSHWIEYFIPEAILNDKFEKAIKNGLMTEEDTDKIIQSYINSPVFPLSILYEE